MNEQKTLFYLDNARRVPVRIGHVVENVGTFGGTGSGKTSGPDQTIITAEMHAGFGLLCACPKPHTALEIAEWADSCGRGKDVIIVKPDGNHVFPVLDWLAKRGSRQAVVKEAVDFLKELAEVNGRGRMTDSGGEGKFFAQMADRLNHAVMTVDLAANRYISVASCLEIIQTIPASVVDAETRDSYCKQTCESALMNCTEDHLPEVRVSVDLLMREMAALDPRPKGSCTVSATVMWSGLGQYPLDRLFTGDGNITPECILDGKIVCIDVPMSMGGVGKTAFVVWKLALQKLLLARIGQRNLRPVTLFLGEGQNYISSSDKDFVAMCRESVSSYHYSSQSIASALSEVAKNHVNSLLASLNLRIYCQNNCDETNEMASMDFGDHELVQYSGSGKMGGWEPFGSSNHPTLKDVGIQISKVRKRVAPPEEFKYMRRGGGKPALVEARVRILNQHGMLGFKCFFDQNIGQRKRSWLDRFKSSEQDVVNLF